MPVALVVEDGTGKVDSNSYVSIAEADTYCETYGKDEWKDASATAIVYVSTNPAVGDTLTLGSLIYTFKSSLSSANDVKIGATADLTLLNLQAAINRTGNYGVQYHNSTTANPDAKAETPTAGSMTVTARTAGVSGNSVAISKTFTAPENYVTGPTLSGGEDLKTAALIAGTRYLDLKYSGSWLGERAHDTQALDWPRALVLDSEGFEIEDDVIPKDLKNANVEAALLYLLGEDPLQKVAPEDSVGLTSESITVGPISISESSGSTAKSIRARYPVIDRWLDSLTVSGDRVVRG